MRTFLDSGVLIAAFRGNNEVSEKAFQIMEDPNREFISSDFVKLEVIPKAKYFHNDDEVEFYNEYFASTIDLFITTSDHINNSFDMACNYGIAGSDAVISCAAIKMNADVFITSERPTTAMFKIPKNDLLVESIYSPKKRSLFSRISEWLKK